MPIVHSEEELGNIELLQFINDTEKRHAEEDEIEKANLKPGETFIPRPQKVYRTFAKHRAHLNRDVYPYKANPKLYDLENYNLEEETGFDNAVHNRIQVPWAEKYRLKVRNKEMSAKDAEKERDEGLDKKCLTEMEFMNIYNIAPKEMTALQLIIEDSDDRFTPEEMEIILNAVMEFLRPEEYKAREQLKEERRQRKKAKKAAGKAAKTADDADEAAPTIPDEQDDVAGGAEEKPEEKKGLSETAKMLQAIR